MKKVPENTAAAIARNPARAILEEVAMPGKSIAQQEARGQIGFVNSDTLPTYMPAEARQLLAAAGVKFGERIESDPLFQIVELPAGWSKQATDHSMWSNLLDDKGRQRAMIFYKAAYYDRSASLTISRRYNMRCDYGREESSAEYVTQVYDGEALVHETDPISLNAEPPRRPQDVRDEANAKAQAWLDEKFPDWRNAGAYWD